MSDNEKTRQKLVDTMRRTKVSATRKAAPKTNVEAKAEPATKPATADKKPAVKKPQQKAAAKVTSQKAVDPYQSRRRVWPD
jgi:hypothetical protein